MKPNDVVLGWTVLAEVVKESDPGHDHWRCRCRCGAERVVQGSKLRAGRWVTCGCVFHVHGMTADQKRLRPIWTGVMQRCRNPNAPGYANYGGRGIRVCDEWADSFARFVADVGPRPGPEYSLDRIDVDGHYEPGNVRWATSTEQMRNTRVNRDVTANGETLCVAAWAERLGCEPMVIHQRLRHGWPPAAAVTTPVVPHVLAERREPTGEQWRKSSPLTALGRTLTVKAWAAEIGCGPMTLVARLNKGWAADDAVTIPVRTWKVAHAATA